MMPGTLEIVARRSHSGDAENSTVVSAVSMR
jgi:hypothetical protein